MANRALSDEQIALLNLQARANLLPVVSSVTQLRGDTAYCPVYIAYGRMADGRYIGFWAIVGQGQWKQAGQEMEFKDDITEDAVAPLLIRHAETWLAQMSKENMLDTGYWSHNRGF